MKLPASTAAASPAAHVACLSKNQLCLLHVARQALPAITASHHPFTPSPLQVLTELTSLSLSGNRIATLPEGRYLTGGCWVLVLWPI